MTPAPTGLLMSQLVAMNDGQAEDMTTYSENAKDPMRVKRVLKEPCCKKQCKAHLGFRLVFQMICYFWALSKTSQDCVLWAIQHATSKLSSFEDDSGSDPENSASSASEQAKIKWSIEGQGLFIQTQIGINIDYYTKPTWNPYPAWCPCISSGGIPVCRQAFIKLLAISPARLVRTRRSYRGVDGRGWSFLVPIMSDVGLPCIARICVDHPKTSQRKGSLANRSSPATTSVLAFLERTYWSIGETLPHETLRHNERQRCCSVPPLYSAPSMLVLDQITTTGPKQSGLM